MLFPHLQYNPWKAGPKAQLVLQLSYIIGKINFTSQIEEIANFAVLYVEIYI